MYLKNTQRERGKFLHLLCNLVLPPTLSLIWHHHHLSFLPQGYTFLLPGSKVARLFLQLFPDFSLSSLSPSLFSLPLSSLSLSLLSPSLLSLSPPSSSSANRSIGFQIGLGGKKSQQQSKPANQTPGLNRTQPCTTSYSSSRCSPSFQSPPGEGTEGEAETKVRMWDVHGTH